MNGAEPARSGGAAVGAGGVTNSPGTAALGTSGHPQARTCNRCGEEKNGLRDFERWRAVCRACEALPAKKKCNKPAADRLTARQVEQLRRDLEQTTTRRARLHTDRAKQGRKAVLA